jgi:hypothetical protein
VSFCHLFFVLVCQFVCLVQNLTTKGLVFQVGCYFDASKVVGKFISLLRINYNSTKQLFK